MLAKHFSLFGTQHPLFIDPLIVLFVTSIHFVFLLFFLFSSLPIHFLFLFYPAYFCFPFLSTPFPFSLSLSSSSLSFLSLSFPFHSQPLLLFFLFVIHSISFYYCTLDFIHFYLFLFSLLPTILLILYKYVEFFIISLISNSCAVFLTPQHSISHHLTLSPSLSFYLRFFHF
jgi:hypothetical protein